MSQPPRLLLVIPHLGGGGAEKVVALLARHLSPAHFEVHLAVITEDGPGPPELPGWVTLHRLQSTRVRRATWPMLQLIRRLRPRIVLSGMAHLNFMVLLLTPLFPARTRVMVRQNTTALASTKSWFTRMLYRTLYPRADQVVCQSASMAKDLHVNFGVSEAKLTVLPNPVDIGAIEAKMGDASLAGQLPLAAGPNLLVVGRLSREKGHDLMLESFAEVRARYPLANLCVLGEGRERAALSEQAQRLGFAASVTFAGHVDRPLDYYPSTTLFALPSRWEGMPNALLEAAAGGLPIVSTPCCEGVVELLSGDPGAWLASSVTSAALTEATLAALAAVYPAEGAWPTRVQHGFLMPFHLEFAIPAWEAALYGILDDRRTSAQRDSR
jgi:glycosyltransferase involved in cell wall biosynthesis